MGRCNPRQVFPIYMCGHHENSKKTNNHENTNTSRFRRFCCCTAEATLSRSSMCICDLESRSPEPSSSAILHRERVNKVFGKRSLRLLSLHQVLHHGSSTSLSVSRGGSSPSTRTLSSRSSSSSSCHRQGITSHVRFLLSNHVLHI
jgi:hypothetical protein